MSGPALIHLSFIAVVVVLLLVAWMAMVLHADEPAPTGQPKPADPGKADATKMEGRSSRALHLLFCWIYQAGGWLSARQRSR